jgi:hypothetical protein
MAPPDRKGGGGLSLQTLVVASAASVTAAMVTARLFPAGTIYASALMPVIVAVASELLHRPANRVSAMREQRRTMTREARRLQTARVPGEAASPLRGAPEWVQGDDPPEPGFASTTNGNGHAHDPLAGVAIHGRTRRPGRPRIHAKVVIATGLAAFAIGAAVLTLPELLFGGSLTSTHDTTYFGGGHKSAPQKTGTRKQAPAKTVTQTTTTPSQTQTTPTGTATQPTQTVAPSGGTPAPGATGTQPTTTVPPPPTTP